MSMKNEGRLRVVWAIDPLGDDIDFSIGAARVLHRFCDRASIEIIPIYLYGSYPLEFSLFTPPNIDPRFREKVRSAFQSIAANGLGDLKASKLHELEIIVKGYAELDEGVEALIQRAEALEADFLFAATHCRKRLNRWFLGSFAESILKKSRLPLLITNPESTADWKVDEVLFASDLSDLSRRAFQRFLPLAKVVRSKVTIYHLGLHSLEEGLTPILSGARLSRHSAQENRAAGAVAAEWCTLAEKAGVGADLIIDLVPERTPSDGIIEKASEIGGWIAIAAQREPTSIGLLGSQSLKVLREARVPIWIHRPSHEIDHCAERGQ